MNLSVEHVLMIVLVAFALHYFMGNCGCRRVEGAKDLDPIGWQDPLLVWLAPHNLELGDCCHMGECGPGLECDADGVLSGDCDFHKYFGICK